MEFLSTIWDGYLNFGKYALVILAAGFVIAIVSVSVIAIIDYIRRITH